MFCSPEFLIVLFFTYHLGYFNSEASMIVLNSDLQCSVYDGALIPGCYQAPAVFEGQIGSSFNVAQFDGRAKMELVLYSDSSCGSDELAKYTVTSNDPQRLIEQPSWIFTPDMPPIQCLLYSPYPDKESKRTEGIEKGSKRDRNDTKKIKELFK